MKVVRCTPLLAISVIGLTIAAAIPVDAATASATLLPGRLAITDMPTALTYKSADGSSDAQTLDASFTLGVTDATGTKAGWHIDAALGSPTTGDGTPIPTLIAIITRVRVTGVTGVAPLGMLAYPRPFHTDSDTVFSAAGGSGMGKSLLTLDTEITVPADAANAATLTTTLTVTISASP